MVADGRQAGQSVRDPARYTPKVVQYIEKFNQAIEHFRRTGHRWPTSSFHSTMLMGIKEIHSPEAFQNWILRSQKRQDQNGQIIEVS